jgi:ABC-type phosphate transport system ATPase subunit
MLSVIIERVAFQTTPIPIPVSILENLSFVYRKKERKREFNLEKPPLNANVHIVATNAPKFNL